MAGKPSEELFDEINRLTKAELESLVTALQEKLGMSVRTSDTYDPYIPVPGFEVYLIECDPHNLQAIKLIREVTYRSLKDSKECLKDLPIKISGYCLDDEAYKIKKKFEAIGAVVKLERIWG